MGFPESVITKTKKGNLEVRNLVERGFYVIYDYRDLNNFERKENKQKIILKNSKKEIKSFFIFPLKEKGKFLIVETESDVKNIKVWNDELKKEEDLFNEWNISNKQYLHKS